jgi:tripartite-type tricarboxylate transporter receptor subunit TctC
VKTRLQAACAMLAFAAALGAAPAFAQDYPTKPVRIVVTFPPGGSSDVTARALSVPLQKHLGQPVVVDNKPGAGGTIAATEIFRAAPDGYNLLMSNTTPISLAPFMLDPQPYDSIKGFTHVSLVATVPDVVMAHPSVPAKSLAELIDWIRAQNRKIFYGSGGIGSIGHIVGETLKKDQGLQMEHVGYKGSAPMHNDLLAGTIKLAIDTLPQNVPFMKDGKLRALAVTSAARAPMAPGVPSVLELGQKKLVAENFLGVSGPAGLPRPVVERLHAAMKKSLANPTVQQRLADLGVQGRDMTPEQFTAFVATQVKEWYQPVKDSGAKLN